MKLGTLASRSRAWSAWSARRGLLYALPEQRKDRLVEEKSIPGRLHGRSRHALWVRLTLT
eukprot:1881173-Rhodomonas_salina.1